MNRETFFYGVENMTVQYDPSNIQNTGLKDLERSSFTKDGDGNTAQRVVVTGGSTGGGSSTTPTYKKMIDFVGSDVIYTGQALPGTLTSAASWQIKKTTFTGDDVSEAFADGDSLFNNVWDDRLSLSYS
jgi:hypothetical protein